MFNLTISPVISKEFGESYMPNNSEDGILAYGFFALGKYLLYNSHNISMVMSGEEDLENNEITHYYDFRDMYNRVIIRVVASADMCPYINRMISDAKIYSERIWKYNRY